MTSDETGGILLDGSFPPVCDRVCPPTFQPSLKPTCHIFSVSHELISVLSGRVLLDGSWRPVSDWLSPPTFLPSLKPACYIFRSLSRTDFPFVGSRFGRRVVTVHVRSTRSADISNLSEADMPYFSKSLPNWLPLKTDRALPSLRCGLQKNSLICISLNNKRITEQHICCIPRSFKLWINFPQSRTSLTALVGRTQFGCIAKRPTCHISKTLTTWLPVRRTVHCVSRSDSVWVYWTTLMTFVLCFTRRIFDEISSKLRIASNHLKTKFR